MCFWVAAIFLVVFALGNKRKLSKYWLAQLSAAINVVPMHLVGFVVQAGAKLKPDIDKLQNFDPSGSTNRPKRNMEHSMQPFASLFADSAECLNARHCSLCNSQTCR